MGIKLVAFISLLMVGVVFWAWDKGLLSLWFLAVPVAFFVGTNLVAVAVHDIRYRKRYLDPPKSALKPGERSW